VTAEPAATPGDLGGSVLIVGTGLIGTSIGLALRARGATVHLRDTNPTVAHIAASRGAGSDEPPRTDPGLVVIATPPEFLSTEIAQALGEFPGSAVTDVGSVKAQQVRQMQGLGLDLRRYIGSHPMAGSERSGPLAASADLFEGRSWAVVRHDDASADALSTVSALVTLCGAVVIPLDLVEHDQAVALVSHLPHVAAALVARRLAGASPTTLALSGPGVRDVTRIAAGQPVLWRQILVANHEAVAGLLAELRADIDDMRAALASADADRIEALLAGGMAGAAAIPGKHGGPSSPLEAVTVAVPDTPGALAHLFSDVGAAGVNIEDVRIDHDPARAFGLVELDVAASIAGGLAAALSERGWNVHA
jgi:prephenate dehydrogenase